MIVLRPTNGPVLVDREALAMITQRSVHTIRLRCELVRYHRGRALYALEAEVERLARIPTRRRDDDDVAS